MSNRAATVQNGRAASLWTSNVETKRAHLRLGFYACIVVAVVAYVIAGALGKLDVHDVNIGFFIFMSIVGAYPRIEIAERVRADVNGPAHVLFGEWKTLQTDGYAMLSSRMHFMQPVLTVLSIANSVLFLAYKIAGPEVVSRSMLVSVLIAQVPLNPMLGLNPIGTWMTRLARSRNVTSAEIAEGILGPPDGGGAAAASEPNALANRRRVIARRPETFNNKVSENNAMRGLIE